MEKYADIFVDSDENKFEYTDIFHKWVDLIETTVENHLKQAVDNFSMEELMRMLEEREGQVDGPIFDMLLSFGEFTNFKELVLEKKRVRPRLAVPL